MQTITPMFTIITVCRNEINNISKTILSAINQKNIDFEFIVIDGKSTDGTSEYLVSKKNLFDALIIEKDKGIYDAMNKGIKLAKGKYLYFLNGGDFFYSDNILENVYKHAEENSFPDIIHGKLAFSKKEGEIEYRENSLFSLKNIFELLEKNHLQQCFFIKKIKFDEIGPLNDNYKFVADAEFIIRSFKHKLSFSFIPIFLCVFDTNGISSQMPKNRLREKRLMVIKTAPITVSLPYIILGLQNYIFNLLKKLK